MADALQCSPQDCNETYTVTNEGAIHRFVAQLANIYRLSTLRAEESSMYWADVATHSKSPLAPLAHVPGVFAALLTPEVAPTTALTLGFAGYGFFGLPKNLIHFTTEAGAASVRASGIIRSSKFFSNGSVTGMYGPGVYMARVGRPLNGIIKKQATVPIFLETPKGTVRILPYMIYVRWGYNGVKIR
ncbi:hypothetical protein [Pseudomonas sp. RIT-PI-AD]|uniref:hypothetical protein n=1 Tax=Pseudomonas sp. RIT-PI-AD TaxID=3035294 RepID=UPI0021D7ED7D|nr:hypothetical protein [Pseudomonas sp. RIT-PI-AD]